MAEWWQTPTTQAWNPPKEFGQDLATGFDQPITDLLPGTVIGSGYHPWGGEVDVATTYQGQPVTEYFIHLDQIAPGAAVGAQLAPGDLVGLGGGQNVGGSHPTDPLYSTGLHTEAGLLTGGAQNISQAVSSIDPSQLIAGGAPGASGAQLTGFGLGNPYSPKGTPGTNPSPSSDPFGIGALGAGFGSIGTAITGIPAAAGHGIANAVGVAWTDLGVFLKRQLVALAVAAVILYVLFG